MPAQTTAQAINPWLLDLRLDLTHILIFGNVARKRLAAA